MKIINESNYVDKAQEVIESLESNTNIHGGSRNANSYKRPKLTTSKIRNILSMTSDIYNDVINLQSDALSSEITSRIEYLRLRCIYEAGRDKIVKDFIKESQLIDVINEINGSKANYILFNRYMEALVAFHKFYDGED